MKKIWVVVIAVVCAGVFFYVGMVYGKNTASSSVASRSGLGGFTSSTRGGFGGRFGGTGAGGTATIGQVISVGSGSMTVQLANGNSQVVFYSSSTQIEEPTVVSPSALVSGSQVVVAGTSNSDGSLTATTIQIRPAGMTNGGFGGGAPSGAGSSGAGNAGSQ